MTRTRIVTALAALGVAVALLAPGEAATPSPGRIAFASGDFNAYVSELDGGRPRAVPRPRGEALSAVSWSPDGRSLALATTGCTAQEEYDVLRSCVAHQGAIVVLQPDGRNARTLVRIPGARILSAAWSPDGRRLAFDVTHVGSDRSVALMLIGADGTGLVALGPGAAPTWSPDGRLIAYVHPLAASVYVIAPTSGAVPTQISPVELTSGMYPGDRPYPPSWSPDGRWVGFAGHVQSEVASAVDGTGLSIWLVAADGSRIRRLPGGTAVGHAPSWSPDGTQVTYEDATGIWVTRTDGRARARLATKSFTTSTGPSQVVIFPAWSPDGRFIAYVQVNRQSMFRESVTLRLVHPDGTGQRVVARLDNPDGSWVDTVWPMPPLHWAPSL